MGSSFNIGLMLVAIVALFCVCFGLFLKIRSGNFVKVKGKEPVKPETLGVELGSKLTFVLFSSELCSTCPQVWRNINETCERLNKAEEKNSFTAVKLDVTDAMDLVEQLNILRTPTVVTLNANGEITGKASGAITPVKLEEYVESLQKTS